MVPKESIKETKNKSTIAIGCKRKRNVEIALVTKEKTGEISLDLRPKNSQNSINTKETH